MFGRFNPPTIGHGRSIDRLIELAAGTDAYVFVTSTQDPVKNPLSVGEKVEILKKMFPNPEVVRIINTDAQDCRTVFKAIYALKDRGYTDISFVGGSDRTEENSRFTLPSYVSIISSGDRQEGVSATNMRRAAREDDWKTFRELTNSRITNSNARNVMAKIKRAMDAPRSPKKKSVKASSKPKTKAGKKNSTRSSRRR